MNHFTAFCDKLIDTQSHFICACTMLDAVIVECYLNITMHDKMTTTGSMRPTIYNGRMFLTGRYITDHFDSVKFSQWIGHEDAS